MTDRELMQQALEALEWCRGEDLAWVNEPEFFTEAITALRERLAQPEQEPRREWVGLTKEEAKEISLANRPYVVDMIAALEAKLKEKNT